MPTRLRSETQNTGALALFAIVVTILLVILSGPGDDPRRRTGARRQLGGARRRRPAGTGQRRPAHARRAEGAVARRSGLGSRRARERQAGARLDASSLSQQRLLISRLAVQGVNIRPEFSYARVLSGFSAPLDARAVALLERDAAVQGVYPVRVAYPASVSSNALERPALASALGNERADAARLRRSRRHDRAARHRRRPDAPVPARQRPARHRRRHA